MCVIHKIITFSGLISLMFPCLIELLIWMGIYFYSGIMSYDESPLTDYMLELVEIISFLCFKIIKMNSSQEHSIVCLYSPQF